MAAWRLLNLGSVFSILRGHLGETGHPEEDAIRQMLDRLDAAGIDTRQGDLARLLERA